MMSFSPALINNLQVDTINAKTVSNLLNHKKVNSV